MRIRFAIIFTLIGLYLMRDGEPQKESPPLQWPERVGYDWDNNRDITKEMADTMTFTGGHWYGNSNLPKNRPYGGGNQKQTTKRVKWINPVGNEAYIRQDEKQLRAWRKQQDRIDELERQVQNQLTEDDVKEIIELNINR